MGKATLRVLAPPGDQLSLAMQRARISPRTSESCCGSTPFAAGAATGCTWMSYIARAALLISPEVPGRLSPLSGTMRAPQTLASPSRSYPCSIPARFKAPHKNEESPTLPIISQTSIVQIFPRIRSTLYTYQRRSAK